MGLTLLNFLKVVWTNTFLDFVWEEVCFMEIVWGILGDRVYYMVFGRLLIQMQIESEKMYAVTEFY